MAGEKISVLGFGCMRFPTTSKNAEDIDAEKSAKMLVYAIENGVNYFDTDVYKRQLHTHCAE